MGQRTVDGRRKAEGGRRKARNARSKETPGSKATAIVESIIANFGQTIALQDFLPLRFNENQSKKSSKPEKLAVRRCGSGTHQSPRATSAYRTSYYLLTRAALFLCEVVRGWIGLYEGGL